MPIQSNQAARMVSQTEHKPNLAIHIQDGTKDIPIALLSISKPDRDSFKLRFRELESDFSRTLQLRAPSQDSMELLSRINRGELKLARLASENGKFLVATPHRLGLRGGAPFGLTSNPLSKWKYNTKNWTKNGSNFVFWSWKDKRQIMDSYNPYIRENILSGIKHGNKHFELANIAPAPAWYIPENFFCGCSHLESIVMENILSINTLPDALFQATPQLKTLVIANNGYDTDFYKNAPYTSLTSLPDNLFKGLNQLHALDLRGNALSTLPSGIFNDLQHLRSLNLSNNNFSSLPMEALSTLSSVEIIDLRGNPLTGIPQDLSKITPNLKELLLD